MPEPASAAAAVDGTFLSVATEKYPKDRDLRENHGFLLRITFLFMNTDHVGLIVVRFSFYALGAQVGARLRWVFLLKLLAYFPAQCARFARLVGGG